MTSSYDIVGRRTCPDRRGRLTPMISSYVFFRGQRKSIRRKGDREKIFFVDIYNTELFISLLTLVILNIIDGYLTLELIHANAVTEANPIMAFYLDIGTGSFFAAKFLFTTVSVVIFCLCKNFVATKIGLLSSLILYALIVMYEITIMDRISDYF